MQCKPSCCPSIVQACPPPTSSNQILWQPFQHNLTLNIARLMQGPWTGEAALAASGSMAGSSSGSTSSDKGRAPSAVQRRTSTRALLARRSQPGKSLLRTYGGRERYGDRGGRQSRRLGEASECGAALGIPKVALLFLTPGPMPLEQVWEALHTNLATACLVATALSMPACMRSQCQHPLC